MRRMSLLVVMILLLTTLVVASPPQQASLFELFLSELRNDVELLADRVFGGTRPESWTGNTTVNSQTIVADIWFDNEQLADAIFGGGIRPDGTPPDLDTWIGATSSDATIVTRNIRHDLELAADTFIGVDVRPDGWISAPPIYRCNRTIQNALGLLARIYGIVPATPESAFNYCNGIATEIDEELIGQTIGDNQSPEQAAALVWAVRGDLERLADETQGLGNRPPSWIGNTNIESPNLISDNLSDLERLAEDLLGAGVRPDGWIGLVSGSPTISHRNLRHDIELLADAALGEGTRPNGWEGADPIILCDATLQNLVLIVQQNFDFVIDADLLGAPDFCSQVGLAANNIAENPPLDVVEIDERFMAESRIAFAYLDPAAIQYMGPMPHGVEFRAWYRNFGGSTMMFVSGDNFAVYIDRRWTTMEEEVYEDLPTLEGVKPLAFCDAGWCNGPGPTPTPTGSGPLLDIINAATPPATIVPADLSDTGKQLVSWNHIRVNYLLDRSDIGASQVTLEICADVGQINCEPVTSVFNNGTGLAAPVVSQFNGLNVYELPYGYSTNFVIEGINLFSTDIWLNDPTLLTPEGG